MDESYDSLMQDVHIPLRSVSLPSRLPPSDDSLAIVSELKSLRSSASIAPPCSAIIQFNLRKLVEMYASVGQLMLFSSGRNRKALIEEAVHDSILLLDVCGYVRDMIMSTKQEVRDLQSVLRRKSRNGCTEVIRQVKSFMCFRKYTRHAISKHLNQLRRIESKNAIRNTRFAKMEDDHSFRIHEALRELSGITVSILRSLLIVFCPSLRAIGSRRWWSFMTRSMLSTEKGKRRNAIELDEMEGIDSAIYLLMKSQVVASEDVRRVQVGLENVIDGSIEGFEERLDGLHKSLIRTRICLLNVLTRSKDFDSLSIQLYVT